MNPLNRLSPKKRAFLTGTLLLTGTGFICRVLGFFYRIFLSRTIGAEGLGLYNMVHPVYGICVAMCAGSIQTALSQYIASHMSRGKLIFRTGLGISMSISFALAFLICRNADFLAVHVLMEPRCAPFLPIMGISVPFAAFHACINGYYYGMQKSKVPAFSQVAEQVVRMVLVFLLADMWIAEGREITVQLAVIGHLIGEIAASVFTFLCLWIIPPEAAPEYVPEHAPKGVSKHVPEAAPTDAPGAAPTDAPEAAPTDAPEAAPTDAPEADDNSVSMFSASVLSPLMALALPLMGNRLVLNLLSSAEAIWIPSRLQMSGLSNSDAFAIYGVLTGMALPFILFPSAITNSMAVLLLPSVAQAQAEGKKGSIAASISMSLRYSLYMGILCIGIFTLFGNTLGISVFHDENAGRFIQILAWLCPFLYLATTMGSILNGLGRTRTTFLQNITALLLRIGFVLIGIPNFGIYAYLIGMLASELLLALMHLWSLKRLTPFSWNAWEMVVKPAALLLISIGILHFACGVFQDLALSVSLLTALRKIPAFFAASFQILFLCFCYGGLLLVFHFAKRG